MAEDNATSHHVDNEEMEGLKLQLADISYRHKLEEAGRTHAEAMYDKAIKRERKAHERCRALNGEIQKLQKAGSEAVAVRKALEDRIRGYSQTKRHLERELALERHSHRCTETHLTYFKDALQLMDRLLQVQSQSEAEDLPRLVVERALLRGDIERLRLEESEKKLAGVESPLRVSNARQEMRIDTDQSWC